MEKRNDDFGNVTQQPSYPAPQPLLGCSLRGLDTRAGRRGSTERRHMNREPLALMTNSERDAYCAFLRRLAGRRRGSLPEKLRNAAAQLSGRWMD